MKKKINIFIYIFLMIGVLLIVYPMILTVITSLKTPQELSRSFFALPERLMLDNFISILTDSEYPRTILNTLVITIFSSLGVVLFIPMVSDAIARKNAAPDQSNVHDEHAQYFWTDRRLCGKCSL